jgi:epoxide hydrolase 4
MPSSSTAPEDPGSVPVVPNDLPSDLREGYAEIDDVRLHYVDAGEGPLVVLLHGFPEFWYGWREQIGPLAVAGFRVVAPDMRGYNLSSKPDGVHAYDTGQLTADIAGLIRERGAGSAMLAGHDWGGSVAWATARACPEVVDRLAILNAAHPRKLSEGLHHPGQLRKSWYFFFFFFFFFFFDLPETVVHAGRWHFFRHFLHDASPAYTPEEMDRYLQAWSQPGAATGMINYYRPRCGPRPNRPKRRCAPSRRPRWSSGGRPIATSARNSPSPTTTCPASTASSACLTLRTGCIHDEAERVTHLLTGFFAPALAK